METVIRIKRYPEHTQYLYRTMQVFEQVLKNDICFDNRNCFIVHFERKDDEIVGCFFVGRRFVWP